MSEFLRLLEIQTRLIHPEDYPSLARAGRMWAHAGKPTQRRELIDLLESIITACTRHGQSYAPIFLRRKWELQRSDWRPRVQ
jgi:hypothetical protein